MNVEQILQARKQTVQHRLTCIQLTTQTFPEYLIANRTVQYHVAHQYKVLVTSQYNSTVQCLQGRPSHLSAREQPSTACISHQLFLPSLPSPLFPIPFPLPSLLFPCPHSFPSFQHPARGLKKHCTLP